MSVENALWGTPSIHGELLNLGFEVAQLSVAKYMAKRPVPPSQGWRTFLRNRAPDVAAMDLFVVPTIGFNLLYQRLSDSGCIDPALGLERSCHRDVCELKTGAKPMIRKLSSGQYRLYSRKINPKTGKRRNLGTFKSRSAAEKHERAVQYFKRH